MVREEGPLRFEYLSIVLNNSLEKWLMIINTNILLVLIFIFFFTLIMGDDIFGSFEKRCCGGDKIGYEMYIVNH